MDLCVFLLLKKSHISFLKAHCQSSLKAGSFPQKPPRIGTKALRLKNKSHSVENKRNITKPTIGRRVEGAICPKSTRLDLDLSRRGRFLCKKQLFCSQAHQHSSVTPKVTGGAIRDLRSVHRSPSARRGNRTRVRTSQVRYWACGAQCQAHTSKSSIDPYGSQ